MILRIIKYSIAIYLLLAGITLALVRRHVIVSWAIWRFLLVIAITPVFGLVLGMLLSVLFRKARYERIFYWVGQLIALLVIATILVKVW